MSDFPFKNELQNGTLLSYCDDQKITAFSEHYFKVLNSKHMSFLHISLKKICRIFSVHYILLQYILVISMIQAIR